MCLSPYTLHELHGQGETFQPSGLGMGLVSWMRGDRYGLLPMRTSTARSPCADARTQVPRRNCWDQRLLSAQPCCTSGAASTLPARPHHVLDRRLPLSRADCREAPSQTGQAFEELPDPRRLNHSSSVLPNPTATRNAPTSKAIRDIKTPASNSES